jgi:V/A-type H+-transporting ATPase subunit I
MVFCLTVALVQLSFAHFINISRYYRSLKVLSELGHLGMLFGMYFLVLSMVVYGTGFGGVELWQYLIILVGFVFVFFFDAYEGSLIGSIKASCSNIISVILTITSAFADIMSYIRLWAVGLCALSVANIINSYTEPLFNNLILLVFGIVFFAIGHIFNMLLNVLAILVHAVRLNTLEFSTHLGLTWSGFPYKPFAKR